MTSFSSLLNQPSPLLTSVHGLISSGLAHPRSTLHNSFYKFLLNPLSIFHAQAQFLDCCVCSLNIIIHTKRLFFSAMKVGMTIKRSGVNPNNSQHCDCKQAIMGYLGQTHDSHNSLYATWKNTKTMFGGMERGCYLFGPLPVRDKLQCHCNFL